MVTIMYLTTYCALSQDHLPVLIDRQCRSFFLNSPDCPDLRSDWPQASLEVWLQSDHDIPNEVAVDALF
jgi:hypothetical protein